MYGSANSSKPALLDDDANAEVVVAFWHAQPKNVLQLLGLEKSLAAARIDDELTRKVWRDEDDGDDAEGYPCVLAGAVARGRRIELAVSEGKPPHDALAEIAESVSRVALLTAPIRERGAGTFEATAAVGAEARVARLVTRGGRPLSNFVAFTSPELGQVRGRSWIGSRAEAAIAAMQDGTVLGTVLFELLDRYRDLEVILARPGSERRTPRKEGETTKGEDSGARAVETFYTDATPGQSASEMWIGDRADLDLLASLVQPLRSAPRTAEDEEEDDSAIDEEAERRDIDAKGGRTAGDERRQSVRFASREALERAGRRLVSRLERSALSIEEVLKMREEAVAVRTASIARQIWMTHIAAFLAERRVLSAENEEVRCLDARSFARYVLRVCRALAGGKDGGVLSLVPQGAWTGPDGDTLRRGLAFLWTCCVWASEHVRQESPSEEIETIWEMVPELIAGRFVGAVKKHCKSLDDRDTARRLPACTNVADLARPARQASRLADLILMTEARGEPARSVAGDAANARPGALVFHRSVGVTVLVEPWADGAYGLLDLSRGDGLIRKFAWGVVEIRAEGWPVRWDAGVARAVGIG